MTNDIEERLLDIFDEHQSVPYVNEVNLEKYFIKLKDLIPKNTIVTGRDTYGYFSWEDYYQLDFSDKSKYEGLKKEQPSFNDKYELIGLATIDQWSYRINCKVKRVCDGNAFEIPLHELRGSGKCKRIKYLLDDFSYWRNCYQEQSSSLKIGEPCYLASTNILCWKCETDMSVVAIAAEKVQGTDTGICILSDITQINEKVLAYIQKYFPNFKLTYSHSTEGSYYANTCPSCNTLSGDFFLHQEPGAPFFPTNESEARHLTLQKLPIDNTTKITAGINQGVGDLILEYAKRIVCK